MVPLVVGFDLDMTLVDSRPGLAATYRALSAQTGVAIDVDLAMSRLGPPLNVELASWFPPEQVVPAADLFRSLYAHVAVPQTPTLPGAREAFAAVRAAGGNIMVITGKFEPNARLHLRHLGLDADVVVGWVWAEGKTPVMRSYGVSVYVGDHPSDMVAARAAAEPAVDLGEITEQTEGEPLRSTLAVGVATGAHASIDLFVAGAHCVLNDLTEFPDWLDAQLRLPELVGVGV